MFQFETCKSVYVFKQGIYKCIICNFGILFGLDADKNVGKQCRTLFIMHIFILLCIKTTYNILRHITPLNRVFLERLIVAEMVKGYTQPLDVILS
jgi:hypothetical protein